MKIEVIKPELAPRRLAGVLRNGSLFLRFRDHKVPDQKTAVLRSGYGPDHTVGLNGTGDIESLSLDDDATPIYEGDQVTITF